ncbi:MAG: phosphatase PAP2 family protein [Endomicrobia bacterium]|nr:phosphatase PAP2 family protein [Endomicrobiia bacterium]
MIEFLRNIDVAIFYFINRNTQNIYFDIIMPFITNPKNFYFAFLILWLFIIFSKEYKYKIAGWTIIVGVTVSDILSSKILKHIFLRKRPFYVLENVNKLVSAAGPSFPSSHAVNSFTVATLIALFFKKPLYTLIAYLMAFLSAYSRVYVGVHYPLDVIAGAVIGILLGLIIYKITQKIFKLEKSNVEINKEDNLSA